jgi:Asp-tRNA(Asn)/Glu-tRNA(Gln) amidotransferase A subunit family amidase
MHTYKRLPVTAPTLSGMPLKVFVESLEGPLGKKIGRKLMRDSGFDRFMEDSAGAATPLQVPLPHPENTPANPEDSLGLAEAAVAAPTSRPGSFSMASIAKIQEAYRKKECTPVEVARRAIEGIERFDQGEDDMSFFIAHLPEDVLKQAEASAARHEKGEILSVLDGVPIAVKDEIDMMPYPTTLGTRFLGVEGAQADSTVVERLRAAGAVLLGKANMQEIGINPIGINPFHGACRNPYQRGHITGGSSSGSAAVVAAGLCPASLGADGGGSIRIPAALCGQVGLKATWGRISEHGVPPLCWNVGHVGPIGATVGDVAAVYSVIAGKDPHDLNTLSQPTPHLDGLADLDLSGIRLGLHRPQFEDAEPEVVKACDDLLEVLKDAGAEVVEVHAPRVNTNWWAHVVIIVTEMATAMREHHIADRRRFGLDTRTNLALAHLFSAREYCHAMRHRHRLTVESLEMMKTVDAIVTPTTAISAPPIPEDTLKSGGQSNIKQVESLMRFVRDSNLTGFPSVSVPAGFDARGLPIGCQITGRPWEENLLLRLALVAEQAVQRQAPTHHVNLLEG